jgi:hypothetical protein
MNWEAILEVSIWFILAAALICAIIFVKSKYITSIFLITGIICSIIGIALMAPSHGGIGDSIGWEFGMFSIGCYIISFTFIGDKGN